MSSETFLLLLRLGFSLSLVFGLMWVAARVLKGRAGMLQRARLDHLEVLERKPLGKGSSIAIVRVGDDTLAQAHHVQWRWVRGHAGDDPRVRNAGGPELQGQFVELPRLRMVFDRESSADIEQLEVEFVDDWQGDSDRLCSTTRRINLTVDVEVDSPEPVATR